MRKSKVSSSTGLLFEELFVLDYRDLKEESLVTPLEPSIFNDKSIVPVVTTRKSSSLYRKGVSWDYSKFNVHYDFFGRLVSNVPVNSINEYLYHCLPNDKKLLGLCGGFRNISYSVSDVGGWQLSDNVVDKSHLCEDVYGLLWDCT